MPLLIPKLILPKGETLLTAPEYLIGRHRKCDIWLPDDPKVSRFHATCFKENGSYFLKDGLIGKFVNGIVKPATRSGNGTFVNKVRLTLENDWKIELKHCDEILLGETCLKFWFPIFRKDTDEGKETYSEKLN